MALLREKCLKIYCQIRKFDNEHPKAVHRCHAACYATYFICIGFGVHAIAEYMALTMLGFLAYEEIKK